MRAGRTTSSQTVTWELFVDHVPFMKRLADTNGHLIDNDAHGESFGDETRSALGVPITVSDTRIGYIVVERSPPTTSTTPTWSDSMPSATLAGSAISNAQLFSSEAELATLEERQRLARELHDAVSQTLWTANLVSDSIRASDSPEEIQRQLVRLKTLTKGALAEMRSLLLELRPASMAETRFTELLEQLTNALAARRSIEAIILLPEPSQQVEPAPQVKHALYRIAQEALNNIGRHSGSNPSRDRTADDRNLSRPENQDNGQGFEVAGAGSDRMGLAIMRERTEQLGATLEVTSQPGLGTTISVLLPIDLVVQRR